MGQESSNLIDEHVPPQTLKDRSIKSIARFIKDGRVRRVVVMVPRSTIVLQFLSG